MGFEVEGVAQRAAVADSHDFVFDHAGPPTAHIAIAHGLVDYFFAGIYGIGEHGVDRGCFGDSGLGHICILRLRYR